MYDPSRESPISYGGFRRVFATTTVLLAATFVPVLPVLGEYPFPPEYPQHDPNWRIRRLTVHLVAMEDDIAPSPGPGWSCVRLRGGFATQTQGEPDIQTTSTLRLYRPDGEIRAMGTNTITAHQGDGSVDLRMVLTEGGYAIYTLEQSIWLDDDVVHLWGTLDIFDMDTGSRSYAGGSTYSQTDGLLEAPDSEPGFHEELESLLGCSYGGMSGAETSPQVASVAGFGLGSAIAMVGNIAVMGLHYILDLFIPYEPPEPDDCEGPRILDGDGESCENVNIPCVGDFQEMCGEIDNLTDVSDSFKQCMRGRRGCGGSTHGRIRIRCEDEDDCGPCGGLADEAAGCNIGGSLLWYCDPTEFPCDCVRTVFHEMSHACGSMDLENNAPLDAYRIGDWFQGQCWPVASAREDGHGRTAKQRRDSNARK